MLHLRLKSFTVFSSLVFCSISGCSSLFAEPWSTTGDVLLRHKIQLLKDEGLIDGVVMTWPYNYGDLYNSLRSAGTIDSDYSFLADSLVLDMMKEAEVEGLEASVSLYGGTDSQPLRSYGSQNRGSYGASLEASQMGETYAFKLRGSYVHDNMDLQRYRLDGSYLAYALGNWSFSVDKIDRWWGPGWEGSLILSDNARPVPALSITRNVSFPSELPVLSWFGPWTATTFMGRMESDRYISNPYLWGFRLELEPFSWLSIGLSRTAQWAGDGRPSGIGDFWNVVIGNDNNDEDLSIAQEPGNQLAGVDIRIKPLKSIPIVLYGQMIGEDAGGFLPTKNMLLGGAEVWGIAPWDSQTTWRAHVEWCDSAARYHKDLTPYSIDELGYAAAYNHHIYKSGYRYHGLSMGHAMDGDGEMLSFGGLLSLKDDTYFGFLLRKTKMNRHGVYKIHSVSTTPSDVDSIELYGGFDLFNVNFEWSIAYYDYGVSELLYINEDVVASFGLTFAL
jgi:hypothetical protein